MALQVFAVLVNVLRLINGVTNRQWILIVGIEEAKNEIKQKLKNKINAFKPMLEIIDAKAKEGLMVH